MSTTATLVQALRVGEPDVAGPLAVFPVFARPCRLEFRSFAEAAALGATVHETDPASVNDVVVHNPLPVPVLLYEGEQVQGAQQDRTLDISVLVPAGARVTVPVSCVEVGRWDGHRHAEPFSPASQAAYPELRRAKSRAAAMSGRADQHEVWSLVEDKAERHGVRSGSGSMKDVFTARNSDVEALAGGIERHDGQIGAVAVIGCEVCVADVIGRSDVFAALHASLVSGYALDAIERADGEVADRPSRTDVEQFVAAALAAPTVPSAVAGMGQRRRFATSTVQGSLLLHEDELIALTAFPGEQAHARVRRPSRRR